METNRMPFEVAYRNHYLPMYSAMAGARQAHEVGVVEFDALSARLQARTGWSVADLVSAITAP
jgi:hypothetical protein